MKKRDIINLIKEENSQDVELTYDFKRVAKEAGISSTINTGNKHIKKYYGWQLFFKYATISLLIVTIFLSGIIIYKTNYSSDTKKPYIEETLTKQFLVAKHFKEQNAEFISTPIKTQIFDGILINIYMGILDNEKVIFVYTFDNLTIGSHVEVITNGKLENVEENNIIADYHYGDMFTSSTLKIENSYELIINTELNNQQINISIELDIAQFLAYLNQ